MKKAIFSICFSLSLLLITSHLYADVISVPAFSADSGVNHLNTFRTTVVNVINGNISGAAGTGANINIKAATVDEPDMYAAANPRVRDNELLLGNSGIDTFASGTLTQNSYVSSGCTPATSVTLTSDISACVAYVAGYRISKGATSETYTASMDTYVDLSQNGVYTLSAVAVGATQPAVASNSARVAKVTTSGTAITTVTDLANRRIPGLVTPANFRSGLHVSRDSTTTITVFPGTCEINNTMVSKTTTTTLTITTAGDWAGGTSLQATSTYGYVGVDASGNLKLHTTAPTHTNYAVSLTAGKKRYATWSSTVYRILGWFYMNATGSGELNSYEVGNIKEGDLANSNTLYSDTSVNSNSTTFVNDTSAVMHFYTSGDPLTAIYNAGTANSGSSMDAITLSVDSAGIVGSERYSPIEDNTTTRLFGVSVEYNKNTLNQGTHTIQGQYKAIGSTAYVNQRSVRATEQ